MAVNLNDDVLLKRYLLGDVKDTARDVIEERYIMDDEYFVRLEAIGDELIEEYLAGRLPGLDKVRFEQYFLNTEQRKERMQIARELAERAGAAKTAVAEYSKRSPAFGREWLGQTAGLVMLACGLFFVAYQTVSTRTLVNRVNVELVKGIQAPVREVFHFVLSPQDPARASSSMTELQVPAGAAALGLQFRVPTHVSASYEIVIRNAEGAILWSQAGLRIESPNSELLGVEIPGVSLPGGEYRVSISSAGPGSSSWLYDFRLLRR